MNDFSPGNQLTLITANLTIGTKRKVADAIRFLSDSDSIGLYPQTEKLLTDFATEIDKIANEKNKAVLNTSALTSESKYALALLLVKVSETDLYPNFPGFNSRRHLTLLAIERVLQRPTTLSNTATVEICRSVRVELDYIYKNHRSSYQVPELVKLTDFVAWMDANSTNNFSRQFIQYWKSTYSEFARSLLLRNVEHESHIIDAAIDGGATDRSISSSVEGYEIDWHLPSEPISSIKRSPGTQRVISEAQLSTITKVRSLSINSTSVLTDDEMKLEVASTCERVKKYIASRLMLLAETEISRLLIAATGISESQIPNLKWMDIGQPVTTPAGISLDCQWLIHPRYRLKDQSAANIPQSASPIAYGACISLPQKLSEMLMHLGVGPKSGTYVFRTINMNGGLSRSVSKVPSTCLRRTFISRIARLEPLGISGAQWAINDSLGISEAPLHYDVISAKYLANQIRQVTFAWFDDRHHKMTYKPMHFLGSLCMSNGKNIKDAYLQKSKLTQTGNRRQDLISEINLRTANTVVGLIATTGHRPNNNMNKLTLNQFDLVEGICFLSDKAVSSNWLHRPAALATLITQEIESLVANLNELLSILPPCKLSESIRKALTGQGPLFLVIDQNDDVRPYDKNDYLSNIDMTIAGKENFARHYLNQYLIPKLPEALRVGQMGWHGQREGCWSELSRWSIKSASEEIRPKLNELLKNIGWKPYEKAIGRTSKSYVASSVDWVALEEAHQKEYRAAVSKEQKREAQRQDAYISSIKKNIAQAISTICPNICLKDNCRLVWANTDQTNIPMNINSNIINEIVSNVTLQIKSDEVNQKIIRNFIIAMFRRANSCGIVNGTIPNRFNLSLNRGPGWFNNSSLMSLKAFRELEDWLIHTKNGLSLQAKTTIGLLLYGGYPDISVIEQVLNKTTKLSRTLSYSNCVIAEPSNEKKSTLVFHDLAAALLMTWHSKKVKFEKNRGVVEAQIYDLLPLKYKPKNANDTFSQLMSLARLRNSITMDGIARFVGCGKVTLTTVSAARISGAIEGRPVPEFREYSVHDPDDGRVVAVKSVSDRQSLSTRNVVSILTKQNRRFEAGEESEVKAKKNASNDLVNILNNISTTPTIAKLLARYCVMLLNEGGEKKDNLKLSTIIKYAETLSRPLATYFKDNPLHKNWHEIFIQIIASTIESQRAHKLDALSRFYQSTKTYCDLPIVDFEILSEIAGEHHLYVNPGYLTNAECDVIIESFSKDVIDLESTNSSSEDIYIAKLVLAYFLARASTSLRTGEALNLNVSDFDISTSTPSITVRRHNRQRLKTDNARRKIFLQGPYSNQAITELSEFTSVQVLKYLGLNKKSTPIFRQFDDVKYISKELVVDRINERVKWVTNNPRATIYFARKMDVWRNISAYQMSEPKSLWPLLDLLVRFGHGRLITTLTSYCHDPFLVFSRWFRSSEELSIDHLCWAMGRSKSYLYRRKGSLKLDKRYMRINDRFTALLADVPYVQPLNTNLPDLQPIVRDEFSLSIKELDYIFRKSNSLNDVQINCDRNHWPLLFVNALIDQIAVLKDEYGISLFNTDGDDSVLKPPRLYSAISSSGVDVLNALSTNIDSKMRFELVEQHLNGEARHGFLNGISASKSFWKQWDDKVKLPAGFQWQSKTQQSIVIRKLELINGDKTNNLVHLIRWQLILEWLASKVNISITT